MVMRLDVRVFYDITANGYFDSFQHPTDFTYLGLHLYIYFFVCFYTKLDSTRGKAKSKKKPTICSSPQKRIQKRDQLTVGEAMKILIPA